MKERFREHERSVRPYFKEMLAVMVAMSKGRGVKTGAVSSIVTERLVEVTR